MLGRWRRLRLWVRIAVLVAVLLVAFATAGYAYFAVRTSGAPASASLGEAPKTTGGSSALEGDWVLAPRDAGFVGYRVRDVLGVVPAPNDAVGRTTAVRATMTIANGRLETMQATADLTTLRSDEEGRDPAAQIALATDRFPKGTFRLTTPVDLQSPRIGEELQLDVHGTLTLHGITKTVDAPVRARWNGDSFQIAGQVEIERTNYELEFPQQIGLRVSGTAKVEAELTFVHPGSSAEPPSNTTGTETTPETPAEPPARGPGRLLATLTRGDDPTTSVYTVDLDGSHLIRITRPAHRPGYWTIDSHPVLSPYGRLLLYSRLLDSPQSTLPPKIYAAEPDGTRRRELSDADGNRARGSSPVFSQNGQKIAWLEGVTGAKTIQVMNRDGSGLKAATDGTFPDADPTLSPDGSAVAFSSFTDAGNNDIFVVDLDVGSRTRLTSGPEYDLGPAWSPDGRRIAFGRNGDIYVMAADSSRVTALTSGSARDGAPSWSPDGRRIAFMRSNETGKSFAGPSRIIVMRADGSRERRVPLDLQALSVTWVP